MPDVETPAVQVYSDVRLVPVDQIRYADYNPNEMDDFTFRKLRQSIDINGFVMPAIGIEQAGGYTLIIDGQHRVEAAKALGIPAIPVNVLGNEEQISPAKRRQLTLLLNELKGKHDHGRTAAVIRDIFALADGETVVLPYSDTVVNDYLTVYSEDLPDRYSPDLGARPKPEPQPVAGGRRSADHSEWLVLTFRLPADAAAVVRKALDLAREQGAGDDDWQCLEVLAADYVASGGAQGEFPDPGGPDEDDPGR